MHPDKTRTVAAGIAKLGIYYKVVSGKESPLKALASPIKLISNLQKSTSDQLWTSPVSCIPRILVGYVSHGPSYLQIVKHQSFTGP